MGAKRLLEVARGGEDGKKDRIITSSVPSAKSAIRKFLLVPTPAGLELCLTTCFCNENEMGMCFIQNS